MIAFVDNSGNQLEYDGADFAITKQAITFYSFKFKGDISVTLKFKRTANNKAIFSNYGIQQIAPMAKLPVSVYRGINKINTGNLLISDISPDYFECFFITGNASWFNLWDFNCNEIVTTKYDVAYGFVNAGRCIPDTWSATEGIIFPVIDWVFSGQMASAGQFGVLNLYGGDGSQFITTNDYKYAQSLFPCLYVHTLIKLLSNHAGTTLTGDILTDKFFNTIIISPNGAQSFPTANTLFGGVPLTVKPEHIAPKVKANELLKWIAASFGCIVTFDNESNTISINKISNKTKQDALDWSKYYISHDLEYSKYFKENNINFPVNSSQPDIVDYNVTAVVPFGGLSVESDKGDKSTNTVYTSIFQPSFDLVGDTRIKYATPATGFYQLEDQEGYAFTSVTNPAGTDEIQFNGTGFPWVNSGNQFVVRVECDSDIYSGYWICQSGTASRLVPYNSIVPGFLGDSTGIIYTQSINYGTAGHRVLSAITSCSPLTFNQYSPIIFPPVLGVSERTTVATAYYHKATTIYSLLNQYNQGLSYGDIDGRNDITLQDKYLQPLTNILKSPPIRAKMILPESVFSAYNYEYIYIEAEDVTGYFIVEKIENYTDSNTPVNVYLLKVD